MIKYIPSDQIHPHNPQNVLMDRILFTPVTADTNNKNKTVRQKCKNMHININLKNNYPIFMSTEILPLFRSCNYLNSSKKKIICFVLQLKSARATMDHSHL